MASYAKLDWDGVQAYVARKTACADTPVRLASALVGINAQLWSSEPLACWARVPGYVAAAEQNPAEVVTAPAMRRTLHVIPSREHRWFRSALWAADRRLARSDPDGPSCREIRALLAEAGPAPTRELTRRAQMPAKAVMAALRILEHHGIAVRVRTGMGKGLDQSPVAGAPYYLWGLAEDLLPPPEQLPETPEQGVVWLLRRYLAAYGPARFEDAVWWTGLPRAAIRDAFRTLRAELTELPGGYVLLAEEEPALRDAAGAAGAEPLVQVLPYFDSLVLAYQSRDRFGEPDRLAQVYRGPLVEPVILVNGRLAGTWNYRPDRLVYRLFDGGAAALSERVEARLAALAAWLGLESPDISDVTGSTSMYRLWGRGGDGE